MIEREELFQESGATLVRPLFDEAATESARPVVPLVTDAAGAARTGAADGSTPARRSQAWALVLGSAIAGSVLGIVGVGLYQQRRTAVAPASAQVEATPTPAAPEPSPPAEFSPNVVVADVTPEPSPTPFKEAPNSAGKAKEIPEPTPTASPVRRDARDVVKKPDETRDEEARDLEAAERKETEAPDRARERANEGEAGWPVQNETRPRRARNVERDANADDQRDEEEEPGPRRVDRVRDIFTGDQPGREERRRERPLRNRERLPKDTP